MDKKELQILIIDDNNDDVDIFSHYLQSYEISCSISHVLTAEEAVNRLKTHKYDICLVDIHLPGMGGLEFVKHILDHGDNLPTIVVTGGGDEKTAAKAIKLGAYDYLLKDEIDAALLNKTILHACEHHSDKEEKERLQKELEAYTNQLESEISERRSAEEALKKAHDELELRVKERTVALRKANEELNVEITDRKLAEEALKKSEELHRLTLSSISDAVLVTDDIGRFTFICPNVDVIFGYSLEDVAKFDNIAALLGNDLFVPGELDRLGELSNIEQSIVDKAGREHVLLVSVKCVSINGGTILYTCRDISARKEAEEMLRKLSMAVEQSPASILITDLEGDIEYVNPKFAEVSGFSYEEALGQNPRILKSGEQSTEFYKELWETISSGKEWKGELYNKKKNGEFFWEEALIAPIVNERGEITNYLGVKEDITERKRVEEELQHKRRLAEMGEMSAQIAHEIRNPLSSINMAYECLEEELSQSEEVRKTFNILGKSIDVLTSITTDLLDYGKSGKVSKVPLDCLALVDEVFFSFNEKINENGVKVVKKLPKQCTSFKGDEVKIRQVIVNVVNNAIQSMERSGTLTLSLTEEEKNLIINVSDTGSGISQENLENIFIPFYTTKKRGTGLGLAIVKHFIDLHGGDVSVESELGKGTTITVKLPLCD